MHSGSALAGIVSPLAALTGTFLELERRAHLFDFELRGVHLWKRIRFGVHGLLLQRLGVRDADSSGGAARMGRTIAGAFRGGAPLHEAELLFVGNGRRTKVEEVWWDPYCDPLATNFPWRKLVAERPFQGRHFKPERGGPVAHLDALTLALAFTTRIARWLPLTSSEKLALNDLEQLVGQALGIPLPVTRLATTALLRHDIARRFWARALSKVRPRAVLLVCSYGHEDLINECHARGVPTIELQHGVTSVYHMGYHFPDGLPQYAQMDFPAHFFSWGRYWTRSVRLPLSSDRQHDVGFAFLEVMKGNGSPPGDEPSQILFLSQETIGGELSRFAAEVARVVPNREVVYRLHPRERNDWRSRYPWLVDAPLAIDFAERPLVEALQRAHTQIGVYSTAIFEGVALGLRTLLLPLPGVEYMTSLLDERRAELVHHAEEVREWMKQSPRLTNREAVASDLFAPGAIQNARAAVDSVLRSSGR